jgi:hypothetical protein
MTCPWAWLGVRGTATWAEDEAWDGSDADGASAGAPHAVTAEAKTIQASFLIKQPPDADFIKVVIGMQRLGLCRPDSVNF